MPGSMFQIGRSGAAAARASLEVTSQNIANATNPDYSRRTLQSRELVGVSATGSGVPSGVRVDGISRNDSAVVQQQARSSASELARADAELEGLRGIELALEESQLFEGLVEFEAALTQLEGNPLEPALRTNALETGRQLAGTFNFADTTLDQARVDSQARANESVSEINRQAAELARINGELVNAREGTVGQAALLDARDAALRDLSQQIGVETTFDDRGAVTVRIEGSPSPLLVDGISASQVEGDFAADGTLSVRVGAVNFAPSSGELAGHAAALSANADFQTQIDDIAADLIARANTAQSNGVDTAGAPAPAFFSGTDAASMALALTSESQIATAPAGSPAGSTNTTNLRALLDSLADPQGPVQSTDRALLSLSSRISAQETTRDGLAAIAENAQATLLAETGVDLDTEAANLVRLQQAFEANSRVLQVASEVFDTILALR
ncbi:MAG: flagellar hook-associated protein FlgK [Erythrobacter sp.]|uniref:flagellar hook-associated protein FlgK n=1 Tax=Erythrobacter sp. TaxID=1042 RepID=UPI00263818CE|nr:flagellar hook-associated protein FlgK [Erythrobacter sp.]MDJ0979150.1 flagellar hook-associated protein FlgK [Erythrobacter sp.]